MIAKDVRLHSGCPCGGPGFFKSVGSLFQKVCDHNSGTMNTERDGDVECAVRR